MSDDDIHRVLKSQIISVMEDHDSGPATWKTLPNTDCQVGFHGSTSLLRIPIDNADSTNWKTLNTMLRRRTSSGHTSYIHLGFDHSNADRLCPFLFELIDSLDKLDDKPMKILDDLLRVWSSLWGEESTIFSKEDQIGALGELLVLEQLLEVRPSQQTLECWKAPEMQDDLHDFEADRGHIEVKTSSSVPRKFYVGSLDQMDHEVISPKSLNLVFVKLLPGTDFTLPDVVERMRTRCSTLGLSVIFDDLLSKRGYRDSEAQEYSGMSFEMDSIDHHLIDEETPIYTTRNLDEIYSAVVRVRQTVDPSQIDFSTINSNDWATIAENIGI